MEPTGRANREITCVCILFFNLFYGAANEVPCCSIPVQGINVPYLNVKIEGNNYSLLFDIGSTHPLMLKQHVIDTLVHKKSVEEGSSTNFRGESVRIAKYLLPAITIETERFADVIVGVEPPGFSNSCELSPRTKGPEKSSCDQLDGSFGSSLLQSYVCLFDFANARLRLYKEPPSIDFAKFIVVPLEVCKGGLFLLSMDIDLGLKQFVLDTGASGSLLRKSLLSDIKQMERERVVKILSEERILYLNSKTALNRQNLGPQIFYLFEFGKGCEDIDGILGMDFFAGRQIYIDFPSRKAYVQMPKQSWWGKLRSFFVRKYTFSDKSNVDFKR